MTNSYVYGSGNELLTEMKASGAWHHSNVYADGRLIATYHDTNTYFSFEDWLAPETKSLGSDPHLGYSS